MSFLQSWSRRPFVSWATALAPVAAMLAAVTAWLWPIGVGGRMPVGGDSTQFSMGLMAVLGRALRAGRLPLWNDLWGFGFPGLAESQMGVYYPPHLLLYRFFSTEAAYTSSLVLHTYFAALGAFWAARRFGVSPWGSALAGFAWSASGTFVIHLPHQWGYTTGAWMPWAVGIAWVLVSERPRLTWALALSAVLAIQILPGHFQFAFETQVLLAVMALWVGMESQRWRAPLLIVLAIAFAIPLSAMQLVPTMQLARSAASQRSYEYLSAFPATPIHLCSYVAPNLFALSPLWRPVAWDPFHAMPEEHRPYLGLVPLLLALGAIRRGFRTDRGTRLLAVLAVVTLLLSLGPYVPGFRLLIVLPGFSFFRAPSRWGLATLLMLAILAGKGFDAWRSWPRIGRATARFVVISALVPLTLVGALELAFASTEGAGMPRMASLFEAAATALPWRGDPSFRQVMASARRGPRDPLILTNLIAQGVEPRAAAGMRLDRERYRIYARELAETGLLLVALVLTGVALARRWLGAEAVLLLFTFGDLLLFSRHRAIQTAPLQPLEAQSPVLGALSRLPEGSRTIDGLRNLPMLAGVAPLSAYRTLDRPALTGLVALAGALLDGSVDRERIRGAMRAVGASLRVIDPLEPSGGEGRNLSDPTLASWLYGAWGPTAPPFRIWTLDGASPRAFFVPGAVEATTDPERILAILSRAKPWTFRSEVPEAFEVEGEATEPGTVVVSVLDDEEWGVEGTGRGRHRTTPALRVFATPNGGAWQGMLISKPGPIRLRWRYGGRAARAGIEVATAAWAAWLGGVYIALRKRRVPGGDRKDHANLN